MEQDNRTVVGIQKSEEGSRMEGVGGYNSNKREEISLYIGEDPNLWLS